MIVNKDNSDANKTGQWERGEVMEASLEEVPRAGVAPRQTWAGAVHRGQRRCPNPKRS